MSTKHNPVLDMHAAVEAIAKMERRALLTGKKPYAISMRPMQWHHIVDYVMEQCQLNKLPKEMEPMVSSTLGNFHGLPVLMMVAEGIALHVA